MWSTISNTCTYTCSETNKQTNNNNNNNINNNNNNKRLWLAYPYRWYDYIFFSISIKSPHPSLHFYSTHTFKEYKRV